jgi:hypothetical protein
MLMNEVVVLKQRALKDCVYNYRSLGSLTSNVTYRKHDNEDLNKYLDFLRSSLGYWLAESPDRAVAQSRPASALFAQFKTTGRKELLEEAIDLQRLIVEKLAWCEQDRVRAHRDLAELLYADYIKTRRNPSLEHAIHA